MQMISVKNACGLCYICLFAVPQLWREELKQAYKTHKLLESIGSTAYAFTFKYWLIDKRLDDTIA